MALRTRGSEWTGFHTACNVHKHSFLDGEVQKFRHALACMLLQKPFEILRGYPSAEFVAYKKFVMRLFGRTGSKQQIKAHSLTSVASGDWRQSERLQVYVALGLSYSEPELRVSIGKQSILLVPKAQMDRNGSSNR
eukprot:2203119-Amphidinium_carterae.3